MSLNDATKPGEVVHAFVSTNPKLQNYWHFKDKPLFIPVAEYSKHTTGHGASSTGTLQHWPITLGLSSPAQYLKNKRLG